MKKDEIMFIKVCIFVYKCASCTHVWRVKCGPHTVHLQSLLELKCRDNVVFDSIIGIGHILTLLSWLDLHAFSILTSAFFKTLSVMTNFVLCLLKLLFKSRISNILVINQLYLGQNLYWNLKAWFPVIASWTKSDFDLFPKKTSCLV